MNTQQLIPGANLTTEQKAMPKSKDKPMSILEILAKRRADLAAKIEILMPFNSKKSDS